MKRVPKMIIAAALTCMIFAGVGCSSTTTSNSGATSTGGATTTASASTSSSTSVDVSAMDFEYSKRDLDASYDESSATKIELSGSSASATGSLASSVKVDGSKVTITAAGTYVLSGSLSNGQVVVEATSSDKIQLVFKDVTIHNDSGPAVYVKQADKVFITLADGTTNTLTDGANYVLEDGSDEPNATLFSKDDLTINGSGTLNVTSSYRDAIASKDDLIITGGTFNVTAVEDALRGRDRVKICDGVFNLASGQDAIKSTNDEDGTKGFVCIDGGTFTIAAGDDALHAESALIINGGTIDVKTSYEAFEAEQIYVNGGTSHLVASDDGINASARGSAGSTDNFTGNRGAMTMGGRQGGGTAASPVTGMNEDPTGSNNASCLIQINGGYTVVDASGDGVDSNGSVEVTGGVLLVSGPTDNGNGAFDYDLQATISGGTVVMVGSTGMAQNFTSGTQPFSFATTSGQAGSTVAVSDSSGNVVCSFTPSKSYGMVIVSSPSLSEGGSYTLTIGGTVSGANADGYATSGTVSGGTSTSITASTTASSGMGGLGSGGMGMNAGNPGAAQQGNAPQGMAPGGVRGGGR